MVLGIGDGAVMMALGAQIQAGERFVIVDKINGQALKPVGHGRDLIIINEDPKDAIGTKAMGLEHGHYRMVACVSGVSRDARDLLCDGGILITGNSADPRWWAHVAHLDGKMLLTNNQTWCKDYQALLSDYDRRSHE